MESRDQLATLLRSITPHHVVPDDVVVEKIVRCVTNDHALARFAHTMVCHLIEEHANVHGRDGAIDCERCTGLEDIVREVEYL